MIEHEVGDHQMYPPKDRIREGKFIGVWRGVCLADVGIAIVDEQNSSNDCHEIGTFCQADQAVKSTSNILIQESTFSLSRGRRDHGSARAVTATV